MEIPEEYRYVMVDSFLSYIARHHGGDIATLTTSRHQHCFRCAIRGARCRAIVDELPRLCRRHPSGPGPVARLQPGLAQSHGERIFRSGQPSRAVDRVVGRGIVDGRDCGIPPSAADARDGAIKVADALRRARRCKRCSLTRPSFCRLSMRLVLSPYWLRP